ACRREKLTNQSVYILHTKFVLWFRPGRVKEVKERRLPCNVNIREHSFRDNRVRVPDVLEAVQRTDRIVELIQSRIIKRCFEFCPNVWKVVTHLFKIDKAHSILREAALKEHFDRAWWSRFPVIGINAAKAAPVRKGGALNSENSKA